MRLVDHKLALKAARLHAEKITGEELAARLKVSSIDHAHDLAKIGAAILKAENCRLTDREFHVFKVIVRMMARRTLLGVDFTTLREVDFSAGKRSGWCRSAILKRMRPTVLHPGHQPLGIVTLDERGHIRLTDTGWMLAWETRLIRATWRVPA